MRLGILGPLLVIDNEGRELSVTAARQRTTLAVLLARANRLVAADALADIVWDGHPPRGSAGTLRSYLARLRHAVGPDVAARIVTREPGYLCQLAEDELDILRFEALCREGGAALRERSWRRAQGTLSEALGLWRGVPLADIASRLLRENCVPHLEQSRLQALEWRIEAELQLGRHEQLVPELRALVDEDPLREHRHAQLMLALYRCGRQAEAMAAFQRARRVTVDELGVEPGPRLKDLYRRILAADADLLAPPPAEPVAAEPVAAEPERAMALAGQRPAVPRHLPAAIEHFTGRADELAALSRLLSRMPEGGGVVMITAIVGTPGIGKTALAVHWSHQVASSFPGGQLYVNLRGFGPTDAPVAPADAIRRFLTALGVPANVIPADPDEQVAFYRSQLADRRLLIVLDNARDVAQVRPLLPGAPGCLVLVTSRNELSGLIALDGAVPLMLDLLTAREARQLLSRRLGSDRIAADEQAAEELIHLCARLPLALNIVAAHATLRPARPLSGLADELRDAHRRLNALTVHDGTADVRAVFSWSYRILSPAAARMFRLLGLHTGPDIGLQAASALAALDADETRRALDELTAAHLLAERTRGRFAFHDLLRAYASEQVKAHASLAEQHDALRRVLDFYIRTALEADGILDPNRSLPVPLGPPIPGVTLASPKDDPAAMAWFEVEHPNLVAAQRIAAEHGWHQFTWYLAWAAITYHFRQSLRDDALAAWLAALDAAAHMPDFASRIIACWRLGTVYADLGRHKEALEYLHQALALAEEHDDRKQLADTHKALAWAWGLQEDYRQAAQHAARARELYHVLGKPTREANALSDLGWCAACLGDYDSARTHCQAALAVHQRLKNLHGEAATLDSLGYIEHHTGNHDRAIGHYQRALELFREHNDAYRIATTLDNIGHPLAAHGDHERARAAWRQALELYRAQARAEDALRVQQQIDGLG